MRRTVLVVSDVMGSQSRRRCAEDVGVKGGGGGGVGR